MLVDSFYVKKYIYFLFLLFKYYILYQSMHTWEPKKNKKKKILSFTRKKKQGENQINKYCTINTFYIVHIIKKP